MYAFITNCKIYLDTYYDCVKWHFFLLFLWPLSPELVFLLMSLKTSLATSLEGKVPWFFFIRSVSELGEFTLCSWLHEICGRLFWKYVNCSNHLNIVMWLQSLKLSEIIRVISATAWKKIQQHVLDIKNQCYKNRWVFCMITQDNDTLIISSDYVDNTKYCMCIDFFTSKPKIVPFINLPFNSYLIKHKILFFLLQWLFLLYLTCNFSVITSVVDYIITKRLTKKHPVSSNYWVYIIIYNIQEKDGFNLHLLQVWCVKSDLLSHVVFHSEGIFLKRKEI